MSRESKTLIVAGVRDEQSIGWSVAEEWLRRGRNNKLLATVRSKQGEKFIGEQHATYPDRVFAPFVADWTEADTPDRLKDTLYFTLRDERSVVGVVHSMASAEEANFTEPAHLLSAESYRDTFDSTTASFVRLVQGAIDHMRMGAGAVTFGYEEYGRFSTNYGGALSVGKVGLNQLVQVMAVSLGESEVQARTLGIIPGFIETYAGKMVAAGIAREARANGAAIKVADVLGAMTKNFQQSAVLSNTTPEFQRVATAKLAVDFVEGGPIWSQSTGEVIRLNAGRSLIAPSVTPNLEQ